MKSNYKAISKFTGYALWLMLIGAGAIILGGVAPTIPNMVAKILVTIILITGSTYFLFDALSKD